MSARGKTHHRNPQNVTRLRKTESLERLRERVEAAADEIVRLRGENTKMATDIANLRATVAEANQQPVIPLEGNPSEVRAKVKGFIDAIDEYLQIES